MNEWMRLFPIFDVVALSPLFFLPCNRFVDLEGEEWEWDGGGGGGVGWI